MLPAVGGGRLRQETPPDEPQGPWPRHRLAASDQAWRHFEVGLDSGALAWDLGTGLLPVCTGLGNDREGRWNLQTGLAKSQNGLQPFPYHGHASMVPPTEPLKFSVSIQWLVPYLP